MHFPWLSLQGFWPKQAGKRIEEVMSRASGAITVSAENGQQHVWHQLSLSMGTLTCMHVPRHTTRTFRTVQQSLASRATQALGTFPDEVHRALGGAVLSLPTELAANIITLAGLHPLSDPSQPQLSRIFKCIFADLNNTVTWLKHRYGHHPALMRAARWEVQARV